MRFDDEHSSFGVISFVLKVSRITIKKTMKPSGSDIESAFWTQVVGLEIQVILA